MSKKDSIQRDREVLRTSTRVWFRTEYTKHHQMFQFKLRIRKPRYQIKESLDASLAGYAAYFQEVWKMLKSKLSRVLVAV
jgi:hypothetical protein